MALVETASAHAKDSTVSESRKRNPYLFVVGCQRSGTTMLQRMLDAHPLLTVAYDSLFIPAVIKDEPVGTDPRMTPKVLETVRSHPRFSRLGVSDEAVERAAAGSKRFSKFVSRLYDELAALRGKALAGEKSPGYCRHLPHLHGIFPWARVIHLIRDGRDVALSIRDWGKGAAKLDLAEREPVAVAALWWRRDVAKGCADGRALGDARYLEVRYEALVGAPEPHLRRIADFLGLDFAPEMLDYHKGKTKQAPGLSPKAAWLPPTPGVRDWRSQMSERDAELFEALAGAELSSLGYERRWPRISPAIAQVARECEAWWAAEMV